MVMLDLAVEEEIPGTEWIQADVTDAGQVSAAVERTLAGAGDRQPRELRGVIGPVGAAQQTAAGEWRRTLDVNLTGTFVTCRAVLPGMLERGSGRIVNFASASAVEYFGRSGRLQRLEGRGDQPHEDSRREVHRGGVRVNAVCPGPVNTRLIDEFLDHVSSEAPDAQEESPRAPGGEGAGHRLGPGPGDGPDRLPRVARRVAPERAVSPDVHQGRARGVPLGGANPQLQLDRPSAIPRTRDGAHPPMVLVEAFI